MDTINNITKKFRTDPSYKEELIDDSDDDSFLKNASANRKQTDVLFLVLHGIALLVLFCLLGYCIGTGNIRRITKGYDNCGNVCGEKNTFAIKLQTSCAAEDMTDRPYLKIDDYQRTCVTKCNQDEIMFGHLCLPGRGENNIEAHYTSFIKGFSKDLYLCSYEILSTVIIALVFAFVILLGLRYMVSAFIWGVLIGTILTFASLSAYFGYTASQIPSGDENENVLIRGSITFGIAAVVLTIVVIAVRKRIPFIAQLFREAGKSITAVPILLFEPVLTVVSIIIVWVCWSYFSLWIESAGTPIELVHGTVTFEQDSVADFTFWYNIFMAIWMVQFICCCQDMLISGVISTWYFASNKNKLGKSIFRSTTNMLKYHLGTLSLSSLIISFMKFLNLLLTLLRRSVRSLVCLQYYFNLLERWMRYYTKNACIVTAIHGYGFREAGSRAFSLIVNNIMKLLAVCTGDYVLSLAKVLIAVAVGLLGSLMIVDKPLENFGLIVFLMVLMAFVVAHCFFSVYAIAVDTIFICFCEDCEANDGINSPYFMSRELMEFVERTKVFCDMQGLQKNGTSGLVVVV